MATLLDRWLDGVEDGWGIPLLLVGFVALWTAFLAIAYHNADQHPDVIEAWARWAGAGLGWSQACAVDGRGDARLDAGISGPRLVVSSALDGQCGDYALDH